jgi:hypothetical protein
VFFVVSRFAFPIPAMTRDAGDLALSLLIADC